MLKRFHFSNCSHVFLLVLLSASNFDAKKVLNFHNSNTTDVTADNTTYTSEYTCADVSHPPSLFQFRFCAFKAHA